MSLHIDSKPGGCAQPENSRREMQVYIQLCPRRRALRAFMTAKRSISRKVIGFKSRSDAWLRAYPRMEATVPRVGIG